MGRKQVEKSRPWIPEQTERLVGRVHVAKVRGWDFQVPIEKEFSWKETQAAHSLMESNQSKGKIICNVD